MRRAFFALAAFAILAASGCNHNPVKNGCSSCGGGIVGGGGNPRPDRIARLPHGAVDQMNNPPHGGPPSATTAYPYYSIRAPRDFLAPNPPSIGY